MHGLAAAHSHGYLPANCTFKLLHLCFTDKPWCVSDPRSGTVGSCWRQASAMGDGPALHPRRHRDGEQVVLSLPDRCEETTGGYDEGFRRGMAGNAHFVLPRSRRAAFWQDIAEMYPRTAHYGEINLLCTL